MLANLLLAFSLALQGAPAPKAKPITVTPAAEAGPSVEVPAELARLTGPDTIAVIFTYKPLSRCFPQFSIASQSCGVSLNASDHQRTIG